MNSHKIVTPWLFPDFEVSGQTDNGVGNIVQLHQMLQWSLHPDQQPAFKTFANKSAKWHCGRHTLICKKNTN